MVRISLRIDEELHDKLRWLAYKERKSQHAIIVEVLEKAMKDVEVPEEERR
jgi:predicted transcriptional regulator